jgi:hypothetical protein
VLKLGVAGENPPEDIQGDAYAELDGDEERCSRGLEFEDDEPVERLASSLRSEREKLDEREAFIDSSPSTR